VDDVLSVSHAARQQLQVILRLLEEREARQAVQAMKKMKKGYDAEGKKDLRDALLHLRTHCGLSDHLIAEELNHNGVVTLTGQGLWTALKVKRFLGS
jgi:hypothetical protein